MAEGKSVPNGFSTMIRFQPAEEVLKPAFSRLSEMSPNTDGGVAM